jgi:hypothetical protein
MAIPDYESEAGIVYPPASIVHRLRMACETEDGDYALDWSDRGATLIEELAEAIKGFLDVWATEANLDRCARLATAIDGLEAALALAKAPVRYDHDPGRRDPVPYDP